MEGVGIVIFKTKSGFRGVQRACPHMQATMMNAELIANDSMVRCPLHVFTFKLSDGKGVNCPGFKLTIYEIKEEDGKFFGKLRTRRVWSGTTEMTAVETRKTNQSEADGSAVPAGLTLSCCNFRSSSCCCSAGSLR